MTLTESLIKLETTQNYDTAIKHPFLRAAGERSISATLLSLWLSQDRIYAAHAYPRFIGSMISKIPFSSHHAIDSPVEGRNKRILTILTYSLQNVVREADFFLETSKKYGLDLDCWNERPETRAYTAEMARVGSHGTLEEGLIFLWAMEKVYLDAWKYAASHPRNSHSQITSANACQALDELEANWTSAEFIRFVADLRDIVDSLDVQPGSEAWKRAEMVWDRVIELEVDFWPGDKDDMRKGAKKCTKNEDKE